MELKDIVLSTLAEMEDIPEQKEMPTIKIKKEFQEEISQEKVLPEISKKEIEQEATSQTVDSEVLYLNSIRERMLVLFEGFQSPNNTNIEAKVDMTLNFLEYVLATIDNRLELLEKGKKL